MNKILYSTALCLVLGIVHAAPPQPGIVDGSIVNKAAKTRKDIQAIEGAVRIQAVDRDQRLLTVVNADGEITTLKVPTEVERFDEVNPGDTIKVTYFRSIAYELRAPTEEEKHNPGSLFGGVETADKGAPPGVGAIGMAKAVTVIDSIDADNGTVTLKGPAGNRLQVDVQDAEVLKTLKPGDTVAVTITESLVINLQPVTP